MFECEILTTGNVRLTITDPVEGEDVAIELALPGGLSSGAAIDKLVTEFVIPAAA